MESTPTSFAQGYCVLTKDLVHLKSTHNVQINLRCWKMYPKVYETTNGNVNVGQFCIETYCPYNSVLCRSYLNTLTSSEVLPLIVSYYKEP